MKHGIMVASLTLVAALAGPPAGAADWPQFMRTSERTGDAADEELKVPLGLVAQVRLDDAVMTSPAVVGGLAYVVDQMGTAYCVDPKVGKVVWRCAPDGEGAMGSNTSSPCVAKGRMYYGTTAGTFHILDTKDGAVVKTIAIGMPIISAPTFANDSIYFQALDAVVRCLDLDGREKWTWDHYRQYQEPPEITKAERTRRGHPGSHERPHYGGGEVTVSGTRVVTSVGWDLLCLDDKGDTPALAWCRRAPQAISANPMSSSISGDWVYTSGMMMDIVFGMLRTPLKDGATVYSSGRGAVAGKGNFGDPAPRECVPGVPNAWTTPAVRGPLVVTRGGAGYSGYLKDLIQVHDVDQARTTTLWQDPTSATPMVASCVLAKDHLVAATLKGQLLVLDLKPTTPGKSEPFIFTTASGKGIGSTPAIAGGGIYFGADDGCLYVLGPGGSVQPRQEEEPLICRPRSKIASATNTTYGWEASGANVANTCFIDDPDLKPPLRVRWAARGFGHFKTPCVATPDGDVISVTFQRTVTCLEQATGRMRWRVRLPVGTPEQGRSAGLLLAGSRLYVPCPWPRGGKMYCLEVADGGIVWSAEMGDTSIWRTASPVLAAGLIVMGHSRQDASVVEAWDAATGKSAWTVPLDVSPDVDAAGCAAGDTVYFTAGAWKSRWKAQGERKRGETVAINARNGQVLWRSTEVFGTALPTLAGDVLLLPEMEAGLWGVSTKDGQVLWNGGAKNLYRYSAGADYVVGRGYGGLGVKYHLADGKAYAGIKPGGQLGGPTHACSMVALTAKYSFAMTVGGLNVRDAATGELLWLSPGFAPRACAGAILANGRVFFPSGASGVVFCWEPAK